jgi:hypothetical protein
MNAVQVAGFECWSYVSQTLALFRIIGSHPASEMPLPWDTILWRSLRVPP